MKIKLYCEVKGEDEPQKVAREFSGWGQGMFFVVFRPWGEPGEEGEPSDDWDEKNLTLYVGLFEKEEDVMVKPGKGKYIPMEQIKVLKVLRSNNEKVEVENWEGKKIMIRDKRTLTIETEKGTFYLPDPCARGKETPTFNGKPITCFF